MNTDETWDEGTDLLSQGVLLVASGVVLVASWLLGRLPRPQGRHRPGYCQASTSCVEATEGCGCQAAEAKP